MLQSPRPSSAGSAARLGVSWCATAWLLASVAGAQTLHVDSSAPPGGNGSSWAQAIPDLAAALVLAGSTPTTQVWVAAGRYTPHASDRTATFTIPDGVEVYGGFAGNETSLDQRDVAANPTVLDGDLAGDDLPGLVNYTDNSHHVVTASGIVSFVLDGFTVRGGSLGGGAGLHVECFQATLANLTVAENHGLGNNNDGGGMWVESEILAVTDCSFVGNRATAGGGALVRSPALGAQTALFERCTFVGGFATTGAAVLVSSGDERSVEVVFSGCTFEDNDGCAGGALFLQESAATIERCRFLANGFRPGCGIGSGGGAVLAHGGSLDVVSTTFVRNNRNALLVETDGAVQLLGSTLFNDAQASVRVTSGSVGLDSCILWGAVATQLVVSASGSFSASHCDVRMDGAGLPGTGNFELDPQFVDAAAGDVHLAAGSPCVDAGNPATFGVGADFERDSRILDGDLDGALRLDVGADEHGPLHLEVLGIPAPGSTLTFVTSGPPMLVVLYAGLPGARFVPRAGTFFLNSAGMLRASWPPPPSSVPVPVSASVIGLFHVQQLGAAGGAFVLSNYVPLQF